MTKADKLNEEINAISRGSATLYELIQNKIKDGTFDISELFKRTLPGATEYLYQVTVNMDQTSRYPYFKIEFESGNVMRVDFKPEYITNK